MSDPIVDERICLVIWRRTRRRRSRLRQHLRLRLLEGAFFPRQEESLLHLREFLEKNGVPAEAATGVTREGRIHLLRIYLSMVLGTLRLGWRVLPGFAALLRERLVPIEAPFVKPEGGPLLRDEFVDRAAAQLEAREGGCRAAHDELRRREPLLGKVIDGVLIRNDRHLKEAGVGDVFRKVAREVIVELAMRMIAAFRMALGKAWEDLEAKMWTAGA